MNLSKVAQWMIRQALGTKRGAMLIELLAGPLGVVIDLATQGRATEALAKLDGIVDSVREVIG